jgi:hypothetical protein
LERESLVIIVKLTIPKVTTLSIEKRACENYLFKDYHLKSGITTRILTLRITGSNTRDAVEISSFPDGPISCQYKPTQKITEMFLFDLQTVAFLVLKNARSIADMETCAIP